MARPSNAETYLSLRCGWTRVFRLVPGYFHNMRPGFVAFLLGLMIHHDVFRGIGWSGQVYDWAYYFHWLGGRWWGVKSISSGNEETPVVAVSRIPWGH
jgi:hypothetical protein